MRARKLGWVVAAGLAGAGWAAPTAGQEVVLESGAAEIELHGRLQVQGRTSSCSGFPIDEPSACQEDVPGLDWFIRRARLTLTARFNDWIEGRLQPEFGQVDEVELKDAWGRLLLGPGAHLTIGHFKRPFDGFQLTSSTRILTIERDLDIPGVSSLKAASLDELTTKFHLSDRDVGIMLNGGTRDGLLRYWVGAFNGRGPKENQDLDTEKQFVGRGQVAVEVGGLPLKLAAAAALTDVPFKRSSGQLDGEYFGAYELWAELGDFDGGPHVQAGLILSENPLQNVAGEELDLEANDPLADAIAWQVIGTYRLAVKRSFFVKAVEPLFRVTRADPNTDLEEDAAWGFTPGVQLFFDGRNRVAINWDFASFSDDVSRSESSFKVMYQFYF
ncbi:MAG: porin [Gemmatimonadota bacterium]